MLSAATLSSPSRTARGGDQSRNTAGQASSGTRYFPDTRGLLSGIAGCLLLVGLVGCTSFHDYVAQGFKVGPDYLRPATPIAADWIDAADKKLNTQEPDLRNWWTVLNDPTLNALVGNAVQQNLTLREAGFRVLQARAARGIASGNFFPQFQEWDGAYSRRGLSKAAANTAFLPSRFFDQWDTGLNLAWEIDFWGRFRRAIEAADADLEASVEAYDQVLVSLLGDIASTYTEIRTIQQRLELARQNVTIQQETANIASARFRGGLVSELDVDQANSNLAQTQALIPQFELQYRVATNRLCILLGEPPLELSNILGRGPIPLAPAQVTVGIPGEMLRRRPDIRRAEREVAAQSARVGVATTELYPHISITGSLGYSAEQIGDLLTSRAMRGTVGPTFQWNILNYGRLLNNIRLQDARLAELIVSYQQQVLVANAEVENGMARFLQSQQRRMLLARSVEAAEKAVRVGLAEYRAGSIDFNRVALVEQNLVQQQDLLTASQGEIILGLIEIYRALGGGWQIRLENLPGAVAIPPGVPGPPLKLPIELVPGEGGEAVPAPVVPDPNAPRLDPNAPKLEPAVPLPEPGEPTEPGEKEGASFSDPDSFWDSARRRKPEGTLFTGGQVFTRPTRLPLTVEEVATMPQPERK